MRKENLLSSNLYNYLRPVIFGTISGTLIIAVFLLLFSYILENNNVSQAYIKPMAIFSCALGSFFGGFIAARIKKINGFMYGLLMGIILFGIILLVSYFTYNEGFGIITLLRFGLMIISGVIGGSLGVNLKKKRK